MDESKQIQIPAGSTNPVTIIRETTAMIIPRIMTVMTVMMMTVR